RGLFSNEAGSGSAPCSSAGAGTSSGASAGKASTALHPSCQA
ncbi:MAG: alanine:cation symporter family protein, partial [Myxococcaceae bacterium]|nr:alanine:cation symporter family protein [Myxococcaceae bacterium]